MADFIICYDIADPRRLGHIHRRLKKLAIPLQYSVFLFRGSENQLQRCLEMLEHQMNRHEDDIRAYPLPQRDLRLVLGPSALPDGVLWSALPSDWQPQEHPTTIPGSDQDMEDAD